MPPPLLDALALASLAALLAVAFAHPPEWLEATVGAGAAVLLLAVPAQAKGEASEILAEARKVADAQIARVKEEAEADRQRRLEETRRQIEAETARSLEQIRTEVADLTLVATSRVVGKVLTEEDHRRLIDEAIGELDFSVLESSDNK